MGARLSDKIRNISSQSGHVPFLEKLRYPILRDLYKEIPFTGPLFQLVKIFEEFWSSLKSIIKSAKPPTRFDQTQLISGLKMTIINLSYLISSIVAPLFLILTSATYRLAIIKKAGLALKQEGLLNSTQLSGLITHVVSTLINWVSSILEAVLGLARGVVLIGTSVPLFLLYPIRYLLPKLNEKRIVDGRKLQIALEKTSLDFAEGGNDSTHTSDGMLNSLEVLTLFRRRLESHKFKLSEASFNAYNTLINKIKKRDDRSNKMLSNMAVRNFIRKLRDEIKEPVKNPANITIKPIPAKDISGKESHSDLSLVRELPDFFRKVVNTSLCNKIDYRNLVENKLLETMKSLPELEDQNAVNPNAHTV